MDRPLRSTQNRVCSWKYASDHPRADAAGVELDVLVTDPEGRELTVPAFQAGEGRWGVRYASPAVGRHRFVTRCSDPGDAALHGRTGAVEIEPGAEDGNPLYRHGPLRRVAAGARHLQHADGTPFLWLADTWWMGLVRRLRWPEDFRRLAADRAGKGFSVALLVAGLYPDMPPFDPRGANESGFPWSEDFATLNPACIVTVCGIEPGARYRAAWFDPRRGHEHDAGTVAPDGGGRWQPPRPPIIQDWVLVLETAEARMER